MSRLLISDERDILAAWELSERDQMAYSLRLPKRFKQWKVKIRDRETVEPPHVTVLRKTLGWRINLRTGELMDAEPDPSEVPEALMKLIKVEANWRTLRARWDSMYPHNRVESEEESEEESR
jgi:hypothetical protein